MFENQYNSFYIPRLVCLAAFRITMGCWRFNGRQSHIQIKKSKSSICVHTTLLGEQLHLCGTQCPEAFNNRIHFSQSMDEIPASIICAQYALTNDVWRNARLIARQYIYSTSKHHLRIVILYKLVHRLAAIRILCAAPTRYMKRRATNWTLCGTDTDRWQISVVAG